MTLAPQIQSRLTPPDIRARSVVYLLRVDPDCPDARRMLTEWQGGMNTNQIAWALQLPEATVYNTLHHLRERARAS